MDFSQLTFSAALPEYILAFLALILVLGAAYLPAGPSGMTMIRGLSLLGYAAAFLALFALPDGRNVIFNGLFSISELATYMKGLVLIGAFFLSWLVSDGWGDDVDSNTIEVHIHNLRKKLGNALNIRTIRGVGYILEELS